MWELFENAAIFKPRKKPSGDTNPADTFTLKFHSLQLRN
jgi:hypothetical protein